MQFPFQIFLFMGHVSFRVFDDRSRSRFFPLTRHGKVMKPKYSHLWKTIVLPPTGKLRLSIACPWLGKFGGPPFSVTTSQKACIGEASHERAEVFAFRPHHFWSHWNPGSPVPRARRRAWVSTVTFVGSNGTGARVVESNGNWWTTYQNAMLKALRKPF